MDPLPVNDQSWWEQQLKCMSISDTPKFPNPMEDQLKELDSILLEARLKCNPRRDDDYYNREAFLAGRDYKLSRSEVVKGEVTQCDLKFQAYIKKLDKLPKGFNLMFQTDFEISLPREFIFRLVWNQFEQISHFGLQVKLMKDWLSEVSKLTDLPEDSSHFDNQKRLRDENSALFEELNTQYKALVERAHHYDAFTYNFPQKGSDEVLKAFRESILDQLNYKETSLALSCKTKEQVFESYKVAQEAGWPFPPLPQDLPSRPRPVEKYEVLNRYGAVLLTLTIS